MKLSHKLLKQARKALIDLLVQYDKVHHPGWTVVDEIDKFFIGVDE